MESRPTDIQIGRCGLASFASDSTKSRGRIWPEAASATRTEFQRDRDRIVHSNAFRRLKHKTQVFVAYEGDHYRTRLTHTIEVSQIARAFARALRLDEDLTEAIALAHDLGHTPFGHAGERALDARMTAYGGFDHNAQALRVVTSLERRYAEFDGLNLSFETLEGIVKHNGPVPSPASGAVRELDSIMPLDLHRHAGAEAQAAAVADDIAYNTHDLDDGLRAGLIQLEDLEALDLAGSILDEVRSRYPDLERSRTIHEIMRRHITRMVEDVISATLARLGEEQIRTVGDVRAAGRPIVDFSATMRASADQTKAFLFRRVYRDPSVMSVMTRAESVVSDLFDRYMREPGEMGPEWGRAAELVGAEANARRVADYLSGMTDTYALGEHRRLFDANSDLR